MRVAYLITRMDSIGGAQVHVRDMALWLKGRGHSPTVITGSRGPICDALMRAKVETLLLHDLVRPIHPWKDLKAVLSVRSVLRQLRPDLVSCHSSKAGIIGRVAAKSINTPVVFTAHGWSFTEGLPTLERHLYRNLERICGSLGDHIITVCDYDRHLALAAKIARSSRISTIHNGMPLLPRDRGRASTSQPITIGMTARFGAQKDHDTLLRALSRLTSRDWSLHLIGGGDQSETVRFAEGLGLTDRIVFVGEIPDVSDHLSEFDIFCLISKWEGFPRSILEAMRAGLPVIASNVAGVRESVEDGETGYLVPVGDDQTLAARLAALIDQPDLRRAMGDKGRAKFESRFTFDHMANPTLDIYHLATRSRTM